MKMELTDEKRKGYVVCALMILVSCLYLVLLLSGKTPKSIKILPEAP